MVKEWFYGNKIRDRWIVPFNDMLNVEETRAVFGDGLPNEGLTREIRRALK